jgi:hypothetical protein
VHALARIAAHGRIFSPAAPFAAWCDGRVLLVRGPSGQVRLDLTSGDVASTELVAVLPAPHAMEPRIETSLFSCAWPGGFELRSAQPPADPGPFDLVGTQGELILVQRPERWPAEAELIAPGQRVVTADAVHIHLTYHHEGEDWRQLHFLRPPFLISAQAPAAVPGFADLARAFAASLRVA